MEVLGAVAGASQLAVYIAKAITSLREVHERLRNAPENIKRHTNHIDSLLDTLQQIERQNLFSSTLVNHLKATSTQAICLGELLKTVFGDYTQPSLRRRYWKLLRGSQESRILIALQALEREKSGLALCLASTNTVLLLKNANIANIMSTDNKDKPANNPLTPPRSPQDNTQTRLPTIDNSGTKCDSGYQQVGVIDPKGDGPVFNISNRDVVCTGTGVQNAGWSSGVFGPSKD